MNRRTNVTDSVTVMTIGVLHLNPTNDSLSVAWWLVRWGVILWIVDRAQANGNLCDRMSRLHLVTSHQGRVIQIGFRDTARSSSSTGTYLIVVFGHYSLQRRESTERCGTQEEERTNQPIVSGILWRARRRISPAKTASGSRNCVDWRGVQ